MKRSKELRASEPIIETNDDVEEVDAANVQQGGDQRLVMLHGEVNEYSISQTVAHLLYLAGQDHRRPIHLVISTYGGSVDEMFSLYDTIHFLPCPVHTIALGKVMSAGVLLLAAGQKGERLIGKSSRIMLHSVNGGCQGNVFEMQNTIKEQKRLQDQMVRGLLAETKLTRKKINEIMNSNQDFYITPFQAIKWGIADRLIGR